MVDYIKIIYEKKKVLFYLYTRKKTTNIYNHIITNE